jgi:transposase InsO family protein
VIAQLQQGGFEVQHLCEVLDVSRAAYYHWCSAAESPRAGADRELAPLVRQVFQQHRRRYGARRIAIELQSQGHSCSRAKARKLLDQMQLRAIQPKSFKPRTTESRHRLGYSPNLLLDGVQVTACNQVWVGDITYIGLAQQFAYLAVLMDLYSRRIVGWSLELDMTETLVLSALRQAIKARQPEPQLIHHTDRGGQYAATRYRELLARAQVRQSMSRADDCYDNAFMESCFGTIKTELEMSNYATFEIAQREIQEYVNYYNTIRRHSSLDYQSPTSFELGRPI